MGGTDSNTMAEAREEWSGDLVALYAEHRGQLAAIGWRILRRHDLAEEAVQDAFVRFHQRGCKPQPGKELAYLRTMVANNAKSTRRRRERLSFRGELDARPARACHDPAPEELCVERIEAAAVRKALRSLSPRQAEVMKLRYLGQLSEHEIAARLRISQGSVKTHASRARDVLRHELRSCA